MVVLMIFIHHFNSLYDSPTITIFSSSTIISKNAFSSSIDLVYGVSAGTSIFKNECILANGTAPKFVNIPTM